MQGCLALEPSKLRCTGDDERGVYRVVPLAIHFAGRSGNFAACLRFLRSLAAPLYEDLRDSIRFRRPKRSLGLNGKKGLTYERMFAILEGQ